MPRRVLSVTFKLGGGKTFSESGTDQLTINPNPTATSGLLRVTANITRNGALAPSHLSLRVWGMTLNDMNQLTQLGQPIGFVTNNFVTVQAGNAGESLTTVFTGQSIGSWVDGSDPPNFAFAVESNEAQYQAIAPAQPLTFQGSAPVTTVLQQLAGAMGYTLELNNTPATALSNPNFPGTLIQQLQAVCTHANLNYAIDTPTATLAIWPKYGNRITPNPPLISAGTGMKGYPQHTQYGLSVTTEYNPNIAIGRTVVLNSVIGPANGQWAVFSLTHDLACDIPEGPWFTTAECYYSGQPTPLG